MPGMFPMECTIVGVTALLVSGWVIRLLIGMQKAVPDKKIFTSWNEIQEAIRGTRDRREFLVLLWTIYLNFTKKGVVGLATPIIIAFGVFVSAGCGPDWLAILEKLPEVTSKICQSIRQLIN